MKKPWIIGLAGAAIVLAAIAGYLLWPRAAWSQAEVATLRGLWIGSLAPLPPDPSNRLADDTRAAALGQQLFFDTRLSVNGQVACATCHLPARDFQDGKPLGQGVGTTARRTMPLAGTAYSPWLFWDGRKDSLWAQALGPLESAVEHGGSRGQYAHLIDQHYRAEYEAVFGPLPSLADAARFPAAAGPVEDAAARAAWQRMAPADRDAVSRIYANIGKAIAAYERTIMPGASRFDQYVAALLQNDSAGMRAALSADEQAGLRLFIGKGQCVNCHNGPLLTNNDFHNTGVPAAPGLPADSGRAQGVRQVLADEFNCLSAYSDAAPEDCGELRFAKADDHALERQFKPPSLRNVAERAPYMHAGQFASLREVLEHYNRAPAAPAGHSELKPLQLSERELGQIEAFLRSLSGQVSAPGCTGCHP
ncbi:cytochrome-c peroxidase [Kouleothrix sp.]|uniref:cytochrome-c peroxidase n=1 Tax=Kouleothrix sp. TaxID=2779161 RepID=UPI00391A9BC0